MTTAAVETTIDSPQGSSNGTTAPNATVDPVAGQSTTETSRTGATAPSRDAPPSDLADRVRFVGRVARAFESAAARGGSLRLRLHPPELGSLNLELSLRQGVMNARVEAESAAARNLLLDNLPALRDRLAELDIKIDRFDVELNQRGAGGSPRGPDDQQHHDTPSGQSDTPSDQPASGPADTPQPNTRPTGPSSFDVTI